jgi:hypothetical protein
MHKKKNDIVIIVLGTYTSPGNDNKKIDVKTSQFQCLNDVFYLQLVATCREMFGIAASTKTYWRAWLKFVPRHPHESPPKWILQKTSWTIQTVVNCK